jgi:inosine-uridine nucleoside N-ribohydrolase
MSKQAPVVICDPGVDDFLALLVLAGAGRPPRAVIGTAGNVDAELTYRNAARTMAVLGIDCPVAKGRDSGLAGPYPETGHPFHGPDGLGGIASLLPEVPRPADPPAALPLIDGAVLATGALTLVAEALDARRQISEVVWMGGAVACGGNMTPTAEFNAWLDPEAADRVLSSGLRVSMVPLDVTLKVQLTPEDLSVMAAQGELAALAARACSHFHPGGGAMIPHDAVAAVAQLHPELFQWEERWVRCELDGHWTRGMTIVDRRQSGRSGQVRVAMDVNPPAIKERIFVALRLLG